MDATQFRTFFAVLHNTERSDLEQSGVIFGGGAGNKDWLRFNNDLTSFVLKLNDERVAKLAGLVEEGMRS